MRKNQQRVFELKNDLANEIKDWFVAKPFKQVEFKKHITIAFETEYLDDTRLEIVTIKFLTNDGFVICDDDTNYALELNELSPYELAYILDELQENNYIVG